MHQPHWEDEALHSCKAERSEEELAFGNKKGKRSSREGDRKGGLCQRAANLNQLCILLSRSVAYLCISFHLIHILSQTKSPHMKVRRSFCKESLQLVV